MYADSAEFPDNSLLIFPLIYEGDSKPIQRLAIVGVLQITRAKIVKIPCIFPVNRDFIGDYIAVDCNHRQINQ